MGDDGMWTADERTRKRIKRGHAARPKRGGSVNKRNRSAPGTEVAPPWLWYPSGGVLEGPIVHDWPVVVRCGYCAAPQLLTEAAVDEALARDAYRPPDRTKDYLLPLR